MSEFDHVSIVRENDEDGKDSEDIEHSDVIDDEPQMPFSPQIVHKGQQLEREHDEKEIESEPATNNCGNFTHLEECPQLPIIKQIKYAYQLDIEDMIEHCADFPGVYVIYCPLRQVGVTTLCTSIAQHSTARYFSDVPSQSVIDTFGATEIILIDLDAQTVPASFFMCIKPDWAVFIFTKTRVETVGVNTEDMSHFEMGRSADGGDVVFV